MNRHTAIRATDHQPPDGGAPTPDRRSITARDRRATPPGIELR